MRVKGYMVTSLLLVFFHSLTVLSYSQDFAKLYRHYIPESILQNKDNIKSVNNELEIYSQLHPDLIYYYLTHLNLRIEKKIKDPGANLKNKLNEILRKSRALKSNWAQNQIESIMESSDYSLKNKAVARYFEPFLGDKDYTVSEIEMDSVNVNKREFFIYVYLLEREGLEFDATVDYKTINEKLISEIREEFIQIYSDISLYLPEERRHFIKRAIHYSYLFKDSYLHRYENTEFLQLNDFIDRMLDDEFKTKKSVHVGLNYYDIPVTFTDQFEISDPVFRYDNEFTIEARAIQFLSTGFTIPLREKYRLFSHLKLSVGISLNQSVTSDFDGISSFPVITAVPGAVFRGYYPIDVMKESAFQLSLSVNTPIYYFRRTIYIEAGTALFYKQVSYKIVLNREGEWTIYNPGSNFEVPLGKEEFVNSYQKLKVAPFISLNYLMPWNIRLNVDYILLDAWGVGIAYQLNL